MSITIKEFNKKYSEDLKGKKIITCEHLKTKSIDNVEINLFIGENTRLLLCPICQKIMIGTSFAYVDKLLMEVKQLSREIGDEEYKKWLATVAKES